MPPKTLLLQAIRWLEKDVDRRRQLAAVYPSTSLRSAPSRQQHAQLVLTDGIADLALPRTTYRGLLRLEHVRQRWPDLDAAYKAEALLREYAHRDGPWQQQRKDDQRRAFEARIRTLRPIRETDPSRQRTKLPAELDTLTRWIVPESNVREDRGQDDFEEYDERTRFVLRRLGGRVQRDASERVKVIDLSHTRVTSKQLKHFKGQLHGMRELRALDLSHTVMSESALRQIADLDGLHALKLCDSELTNQGMQHLQELQSLRYLSLANTRVTTSGLERLKSIRNLQCVNLGGTNVDDGVLPLLAACPDLSVLSLASTRVSAACDLSSFHALTYLDLANTSVTDEVVATLVGLPSLQTLILDYTRISDQCASDLARLTQLNELSLLGTKFGDAGLTKLELLTSISRLNVRSTRVTQNGLDRFSLSRPRVLLVSEANRVRSVDSQRRKLELEHNRQHDCCFESE